MLLLPILCAAIALPLSNADYVPPRLDTAALHVGPDPANPMAPYLMSGTAPPADSKPAESLSEIRDRLREAHIVNDVLPASFMPEFVLSLKYAGRPVEMGQLLPANHTELEPTIEFDAPSGQVFTATIIDPDAPAPSRHGYRSYRHFLAANLDAMPSSTSDILTTYQAPRPQPDTGAHRYAVLVFRQQNRIDFRQEDVPRSRVRFDPVEWAKAQGMRPVAATYFMVENFESSSF
ncbi:Phosphatidylethanolamine-binding protein 1 [Coemansia sp. RSA 1933]|nr:Phosphatidylethanolamine-binding protein 1 [Coemansia sp. RSA 1933]